MANELYKRFLHQLAHFRIWIQHVHRTVHREHGAQFADFDHLPDHAFPTETRQTVVPYGGQQLLHVRMSYELRTHARMLADDGIWTTVVRGFIAFEWSGDPPERV